VTIYEPSYWPRVLVLGGWWWEGKCFTILNMQERHGEIYATVPGELIWILIGIYHLNINPW
jgi:hypothetical protein